MVNWLKPNNVVEEKPISEDKKEYKYHLTLRPFDIGTYPKDNFVKFEDDGTRFGSIVYSKPVPQSEISHYSLSPITEAGELNGKTIYSGEYPWVLELKMNPRGYYYFEAVQYDNGEEVDRMNLTAEEVLRNLREGRYTTQKPVVQSPIKGEEPVFKTPLEKKLEEAEKRKETETQEAIDKLAPVVGKYGWKVENENGRIALFNRTGKKVAVITGNNGKYVISHPDGEKILSGNKDLAGAVEKTMKDYWYAKEIESKPVEKLGETLRNDLNDIAKYPTGTKVKIVKLIWSGDTETLYYEIKLPDQYTNDREGYILNKNLERKKDNPFNSVYDNDIISIEVVGKGTGLRNDVTPAPKPKTSFTDKVKQGLKEDEAKRLDELRAKLRGKLGNLNAGLDPETFLLAAEATALVVKSGVRQFSDFVVTMVDMLGENIKPELAALYEYTRRAGSREFASEMTPTAEVDNTNIDEVLQQSDLNNVNLDNQNNDDVHDRPGNSEQDSPEGENELPEDGADVQGQRGRSRNYGRRNSGGSRKGNRGRTGGKSGSGLFTFDFGEQSDNELPEDNRDEQPENDDAGNADGRGNRTDSPEGVDDEQGTNDADNQNAET